MAELFQRCPIVTLVYENVLYTQQGRGSMIVAYLLRRGEANLGKSI